MESTNTATNTGKKRKLGAKGIIIIVLLIVLIFVLLINWLTDLMWFKDLTYLSVFLTKLFTQLKIGIPTFVVITFLAYIYLKFIKKGYVKRVESDELPDNKKLNLITWGLAGAFGAITTYFAVTRLWFQTLQFTHSSDFDIKDPLYNIDISFYVFKLNFIEQLNQIVILLINRSIWNQGVSFFKSILGNPQSIPFVCFSFTKFCITILLHLVWIYQTDW